MIRYQHRKKIALKPRWLSGLRCRPYLYIRSPVIIVQRIVHWRRCRFDSCPGQTFLLFYFLYKLEVFDRALSNGAIFSPIRKLVIKPWLLRAANWGLLFIFFLYHFPFYFARERPVFRGNLGTTGILYPLGIFILHSIHWQTICRLR